MRVWTFDLKKLLGFLCSLLIVWVLVLPAFADFVPGEIIVKFKAASSLQTRGNLLISSPDAKLKEINAKYNIQSTERVYKKEVFSGRVNFRNYKAQSLASDLDLTYRIKFPTSQPIEEIVNAYRDNPLVEYAEPNYIVHAHVVPNDPYYASRQWGLQKINAESGWSVTTGTSQTVIAVIDTGVNYDHEDLVGKVIKGYNFVDNTADPMDDQYPGHGTACSGVIGALTDNGLGIAGLDWNTKILAVKALDSDGSGSHADVAAAIHYSADHGAAVLSMSFGDTQGSSTLRSAVDYAYAQGCLLVASAGNDGVTTPAYPAGYTDKVIAVAATDSNDRRSVWNSSQSSNYGTWITVSAPGTDIFTLQRSSPWYRSLSGTSFSCPFVAGLAGLLLGLHPTWGQSEVTDQIKSTCTNIDALNPGAEGMMGAGRIDVSRALNAPFASITSPADNANITGTVNITGNASGESFDSYKLEIGKGITPSVWTQIGATHTTPIVNGLLETWQTVPGPNGLYTLRLTVTSNGLSESTATVQVNINNPLEVLGKVLAGPNPFSTLKGETFQIQYTLSVDTHVVFEIYSMTGERIIRVENDQAGGKQTLSWNGNYQDGRRASNGAYLYRIYSSGGDVKTLLAKGKLLLIN